MPIQRMKQRRGTSSQWASANPILDEGELGYDVTTEVIKIGDGIKVWSDLPPILDSLYAKLIDLTKYDSIRMIELTTSETADASSQIQNQIDAALEEGITRFCLPSRTLTLENPVYLDSEDPNALYNIFGNGRSTKLILGGGLDGQFAFMSNFKREAPTTKRLTSLGPLSGRVTVSDMSISSLVGAGAPTFTYGASILKTAGLHGKLLNIFGDRLLTGLTWTSYVDGMTVEGCHWNNPKADPTTPLGYGVLFRQLYHGDAVRIVRCKGGRNAPLVYMTKNGGATIESCVGGRYEFLSSRGIEIISHHADGDQTFGTGPIFRVKNSQVTFRSPWWHIGPVPGGNNDEHWLTIDDSGSSTYNSRVVVDHPTGTYRIDSKIPQVDEESEEVPESVIEDVRIPDIKLISPRRATKLIVRDPAYYVWRLGAVQMDPEAIQVSSDNTELSTVLEKHKHRLTETFEISADDVGGSWRLDGAIPGFGLRLALPEPIFSAAATDTNIGGTLILGNRYSYVAALRDRDNNYTALSSYLSVTSDEFGQASQLNFSLPNLPCVLVLWRKDTTVGSDADVTTNPTHYIEIPFSTGLTRIRDTGELVNGRPWITTSVPIPTTVAASNKTSNQVQQRGLALPGTVLTRFTIKNNSNTVAGSTDGISTAMQDILAGSLEFSFVAPNSGIVSIEWRGYFSNGGAAAAGITWGLRDATDPGAVVDLTNTATRIGQIEVSSTVNQAGAALRNVLFYIPDLVPGKTYTYRLAHATDTADRVARYNWGPARSTIVRVLAA